MFTKFVFYLCNLWQFFRLEDLPRLSIIQKYVFSSSLTLNVVSRPSRPCNFVMTCVYWDLLDIDLSRKRRRSFGHKFMLDNRCDIIPYIIEIGRNIIEYAIRSLHDEIIST